MSLSNNISECNGSLLCSTALPFVKINKYIILNRVIFQKSQPSDGKTGTRHNNCDCVNRFAQKS